MLNLISKRWKQCKDQNRGLILVFLILSDVPVAVSPTSASPLIFFEVALHCGSLVHG